MPDITTTYYFAEDRKTFAPKAKAVYLVRVTLDEDGDLVKERWGIVEAEKSLPDGGQVQPANSEDLGS